MDRPVIHGPHHDLESVYWVLLWVILRHTKHNLGQEYCRTIFSISDADGPKLRWLMRLPGQSGSSLVIENNPPLTELMVAFKAMVTATVYALHGLNPNDPSAVLTYDAVLAIFDVARGWLVPSLEYRYDRTWNIYFSWTPAPVLAWIVIICWPPRGERPRRIPKSSSALIA